MAHIHYHTNERTAADTAGTVALVVLLLGVLVVGIIAYRNLFPSTDVNLNQTFPQQQVAPSAPPATNESGNQAPAATDSL